MLDLEYVEIDGLPYPNIETGMEYIESNLSRYGILCFRYLHEHKREMYRMKAHPMPLEDMRERVRLRTQVLHIADEIVMAELIYI